VKLLLTAWLTTALVSFLWPIAHGLNHRAPYGWEYEATMGDVVGGVPWTELPGAPPPWSLSPSQQDDLNARYGWPN